MIVVGVIVGLIVLAIVGFLLMLLIDEHGGMITLVAGCGGIAALVIGYVAAAPTIMIAGGVGIAVAVVALMIMGALD